MLPNTSLLYFYEVVRAGSVRKAAEQLHISASSISRMIQKVEHRFKVPLFERSSEGMRLTPEGRILAEELEGVMTKITDAESHIAELRGLRRGEVRIHGVDAVIKQLAPIFLTAFHRRHPDVSFVVSSVGTDEVVAALLAYEAEIGVAYNLQPHAGIETIGVFDYPLCALVAPHHPLARRRQVSLKEVVAYRMAVPNATFGVRRTIDAALKSMKLSMSIVLTTNSLSLARKMACAGDVVTLSSAFSAQDEIAAGQLVAVELKEKKNVTGRISVCKKAGRRLPVAALELLKDIEKAFPKSGRYSAKR